VLHGDPAPPPEKGAEPPSQFLPHFYCGEMAGCIKMALGMELGLSPRDFCVRCGRSPFLQKGGRVPQFLPMYIVAKWLDA